MFGFGKKQQEVSAFVLEPVEEKVGGVECAWCLAEQGIAPLDGSHGICFFHSQQMLAQAVGRRAQRKRGRE